MHPTQNLPVIAAPPDQRPSDPDALSPADILRQAALYIDRHGLCKGDFYFGRLRWSTPPACPAGAIGMTVHGRPTENPGDPTLPGHRAYCRALSVLAFYLVETGHITEEAFFDTDTLPDTVTADAENIGHWSDDDDRTDTDVSATLRAAAYKHDLIAGGAR